MVNKGNMYKENIYQSYNNEALDQAYFELLSFPTNEIDLDIINQKYRLIDEYTKRGLDLPKLGETKNMQLLTPKQLCPICQNYVFNKDKGKVCGITQNKPDFGQSCLHFKPDLKIWEQIVAQKEIERIQREKEEAYNNSTSVKIWKFARFLRVLRFFLGRS